MLIQDEDMGAQELKAIRFEIDVFDGNEEFQLWSSRN